MKLTLLFNKHYWWDIKYKVKCFFHPKQEWLTNIIPDTFCDKTELIPRMLFACLVNYIEEERKQYFVHEIGYDWSEELKDGRVSLEYVDRVNARDEELMKAYKWIKLERDRQQLKIDSAYPPREPLETMFSESKTADGHYELVVSPERSACYKEVHRLEQIMIEKDKACMNTIVKYYDQMWT